MPKYVNNFFGGQTLVLDGSEWRSCQFRQCRIVISRGNFSLVDCTFDSCRFEFGGEAENLLQFFFNMPADLQNSIRSGMVGSHGTTEERTGS